LFRRLRISGRLTGRRLGFRRAVDRRGRTFLAVSGWRRLGTRFRFLLSGLGLVVVADGRRPRGALPAIRPCGRGFGEFVKKSLKMCPKSFLVKTMTFILPSKKVGQKF
jgi:hypothetical protein